jgi:hypothetical protein
MEKQCSNCLFFKNRDSDGGMCDKDLTLKANYDSCKSHKFRLLELWLMEFANDYLIEEQPSSVIVDEEEGSVWFQSSDGETEMNQITIIKWLIDRLDKYEKIKLTK